RNV
ncbi:hypothetical protein CP8484711_1191B, partial [Chlamydia psittaci 84-8471/1]